MRVNSHGQRGPEVALDKGERFRIAVVGDSIAFGNFLPEEHVFPYRLAALLEEARPGAFDVVNFAVGGYDIVQEVAVVERKVLAFEPDLVVLAMCLNDVGVMSMNREYLDKFQAQRQSPLFASHLYRFAMARLGRKQLVTATVNANDPEVFAARYREHIDPIGADELELRRLMAAVPPGDILGWYGDEVRIGRLRHSLRRLAEISAREELEVLVLVFPFIAWSDGKYPYGLLHEIVRREVARAGFPLLDITPRFVAHPYEALRARPDDGLHPSELGHRLTAEVLRDFVLAR